MNWWLRSRIRLRKPEKESKGNQGNKGEKEKIKARRFAESAGDGTR